MAVKIRLKRMGKKKRPFYRIVVSDSRSPRDGKFIEKIGHYNPITDPREVVINEERAIYWLTRGAIPTDTVKSLFKEKGINIRFDLMRKGKSEKEIIEELRKYEVLMLEKRKKQEVLRLSKMKEKEKKVEESVKQEKKDTEGGTEE
ncbi:30S ribosomal protein S16 [candidate division KSB1 bacterium]|nr:MAG: 30S ribosomal protein S16 [candidate division KSB1 bacterium]